MITENFPNLAKEIDLQCVNRENWRRSLLLWAPEERVGESHPLSLLSLPVSSLTPVAAGACRYQNLGSRGNPVASSLCPPATWSQAMVHSQEVNGGAG